MIELEFLLLLLCQERLQRPLPQLQLESLQLVYLLISTSRWWVQCGYYVPLSFSTGARLLPPHLLLPPSLPLFILHLHLVSSPQLRLKSTAPELYLLQTCPLRHLLREITQPAVIQITQRTRGSRLTIITINSFLLGLF